MSNDPIEDRDGDGIGDLQGIISQLEYLKDTEVTEFSLAPIYRSPQIDGDYYVSNFMKVDPIFGSLTDFQEFVGTAHKKNLKVILDFVPNHSSDQHVWFQNSVQRVEPYTDYYVWRDGISSKNNVQPPNNWLSVFDGSAWTWNDQRQQYYLHQFHASQPDLNFRNPAVLTEITNILRFWLDRGVDGVRISSVAYLFENANFLDEPFNENPGLNITETNYDYLQHIYTTDLDETNEIVYQWRAIIDEYVVQSIGETGILITDSTDYLNVAYSDPVKVTAVPLSANAAVILYQRGIEVEDNMQLPMTLPPITQPPATQPPITQPPITQPPITQPPSTQPPNTQPPATQLPITQPPTTQPPITQPPITQPPITQTPITQPPITQPPITHPPTTQPPTTQSPFTQPPITQPPSTQPPITQPPITQPPITQPPITQPPITQPPTTQPPNSQPPATQPPITQPPPTTPIFVNGEILGDLDWWQTANIYQIYPKSFQDSNGDGVGDLQGVISRLDHLNEIGVTAIWLNSIFESPQIDGGFDVSNFTAIDPIFGTVEDFVELIQQAHDKSIKVIIDFVPNHSSKEHVWFENSIAKIEPYSDFYVWRNGVTSDSGLQPPNNWLSVFGNSTWTWNVQRQQYYLHQFHTSQPDLNFRNPSVLAEITNVLKFWLDQGVDGFLISSVAHLFEDLNFLDEPLNESPGQDVIETDYDYLQHIYTTDLDETIEMVYQWRAIVDEYAAQSDGRSRILITDSAANQDIVSRYFGNESYHGAHLPLNLAIIANLTPESRASSYINVLNEWFAALPENGTSSWILGNHNHRRVASRLGFNRADGLNMLHLLPGSAFTYMGEELALLDTQIPFAITQDPHAINAGPDRFHLFTRDPARTPYHWDNSTSAGFSMNTSTWLPVNENYLSRNLAFQIATNRSNFNTYKAILELRQSETIKRGATHFLSLNDDTVFAFTRQQEAKAIFVVVINLGLRTVSANLSEFPGLPSEEIEVCLASSNAIITTGTVVNITAVPLSANAAVVLCNTQISETTTSTAPTTTNSKTEPDSSEDDIVQTTTEDPNAGATAVHTSSVLLVISFWSILLSI